MRIARIRTGDGQWARAKSFDTFGPLGPWIEPGDVSEVEIVGIGILRNPVAGA